MTNIVICADGTWNRPEEDIKRDFPTNVLKLARAIQPSFHEINQHVFYDWGLGSYHDRVIAGAIGHGIDKNILDGYRYIVQNYAPGDKIYLFGFSRGAYTVRALSGLINNCGILHRKEARRIVEAWKMYKSRLKKHRPNGVAARQFREAHSHPSREIHFIGVFDTVGALGIPFSLMGFFQNRDEFFDTKMGPNISVARHVMAIDEQREDFEPTIWQPRGGVDLKQIWFAGVHTDIGGSYPPDKETGIRASDITLEWMMNEAENAGLVMEPYLRASITDGVLGTLHTSRNHVYRFKSPLHRPLVVEGKPTKIHPSVKTRYEMDAGYRPPKLKALVEQYGWEGLDVGV